MQNQTITPKQRLWISWILNNKATFLKGKVDAKSNHIALNWTYLNGEYDVSTRELLNYILKEFNKDEEAKKQWKLYRMEQKNLFEQVQGISGGLTPSSQHSQ